MWDFWCVKQGEFMGLWDLKWDFQKSSDKIRENQQRTEEMRKNKKQALENLFLKICSYHFSLFGAV